MTELSIIIPTLNEASNIRPLLESIEKNLAGISHEIIVVDDNSPDGTGRIVEEVAQTNAFINLIVRRDKTGLSAAVIEGFRQAKGSYLAVMDADFSHDPALLPELLNQAKKGYDLTVGSRRIPGGGADYWPWYRRSLSALATKLSLWWLGTPLHDPMSGFFIAKSKLVDQIWVELNPRGYKILLEIAVRGSVQNIKEVPFIFKDRKQGHSKLSGNVMGQYLLMLWDLRAHSRPFHILRSMFHTGRYKKVATYLIPGNVLNIGCGKPCETMSDQAFLRFLNRPESTGVDIKDVQGPHPFVKVSLTDLPFPDGRFDNVVIFDFLGRGADFNEMLAEISRVMKQEGVFIATMPDFGWFGRFFWSAWSGLLGRKWHDSHTTYFNQSKWKREIGKYFTLHQSKRHWIFTSIFICKK